MLGEKIKQIRKSQGLTLQDVAEKTGFSAGYLSNIERDATSPTVVNLQIICDALRVNVSDVVQVDKKFSPIVRGCERKVLFIDKDTSLEQVAAGGESLRVTRQIFDSKFQTGMLSVQGHNVDVVALVESGKIHIEMQHEKYELDVGDSVYIRANTPYRIFPETGTESSVIWFTLQTVVNMKLVDL